jgi:hypothetical protein
MSALRIIENHDWLLYSADGASGVESVAARNRWALAATFVLVALGLLLCAQRASLAKQPARVPDPAGPATPQRPVGQGPKSAPNAGRAPVAQSRPAPPRAERPVRGEPANGGPASRPAGQPARPRPAGPEPAPKADPRSPVAQSRPVRGEGVHRGPVSQPAHRPPAEHGPPVDRGKPAHVPREHPQGHSQGPQKPVGQDPVRPHPEKPVDRGPVSHPDQQPTPKPKPVHEPRDNPQGGTQGGEDTGRPEGTGSHGQQGESEGPPDKENTPTPGNGLAEAPAQQEGHPGQGTATDHGPDEGGHLPAAVGKGSDGGGTGYEGTAAHKPAGGPPSGTDMGQQPDRRAASAALPGHEPGSGTRSTEESSRRPSKAAVDTPTPHPTAVHREDPVRPTGNSSRLPDEKVAGHSRAAEAASPAAPTGGERSPVGHGVRAASEASFGSTGYFFGYLWDGSSFSVQRDGLGPTRDEARGFVPATRHGGSLTQRAPPLPIPSPFSGFGLTMGGLVFSASSSGDGGAPLFAVIFCCLSAVLWRGRSRAYGALLRAGTVPRLALERPG